MGPVSRQQKLHAEERVFGYDPAYGAVLAGTSQHKTWAHIPLSCLCRGLANEAH